VRQSRRYRHAAIDIRDRDDVLSLAADVKPDLIISHRRTAIAESHPDWLEVSRA
jgi:hypothetical protein